MGYSLTLYLEVLPGQVTKQAFERTGPRAVKLQCAFRTKISQLGFKPHMNCLFQHLVLSRMTVSYPPAVDNYHTDLVSCPFCGRAGVTSASVTLVSPFWDNSVYSHTVQCGRTASSHRADSLEM